MRRVCCPGGKIGLANWTPESFIGRYVPPAPGMKSPALWGSKAFEADLYALLDKFNVAGDGTLVLPSEYLEVVITKMS